MDDRLFYQFELVRQLSHNHNHDSQVQHTLNININTNINNANEINKLDYHGRVLKESYCKYISDHKYCQRLSETEDTPFV